MNVSLHLRRLSAVLSLILCSVCSASASAQTRLVISQMYGGGGNTGAPYTNDFLELYNPTANTISLSGLSIQYAAATSAAWNSVPFPSNASVAPGQFYLVQAAAGTTVTNKPLPVTADFVITANGSTGNQLNFSATAGKVAIVNGTAALTVACPAATAYVDLIGFGSTANCFEGTGPAPAPSNTTADLRTAVNTDLVNNALDFTAAAPSPRNSGSPSVPVTPTAISIHAIQGVKSTTASTVSPYAGQQVTTTGVVTSILSNAFFIQSRDADADSNALTPEGIEVFTSTAPSAATVALGNYVSVTGTVQTYPATTASHTPATEITSPTVTLISAGTAANLPTPITLTMSNLTPTGGLYQLTPYEGMRVSIGSLTAVSGTTGSISSANEAAEKATSTGYFFAVITGTARPFREPGIDLRDPAVPNLSANVATFDDNPERILVDTDLSGGTSIELSTGAVLSNVTGVLDFTFSSDTYYDPSRLILDASYNRSNVVAGMTVQPVPLPAANEFVVASYNVERFYNPAQTPSDDLYYVPAGVTGYNGNTGTTSTGQTYTSSAVDVTPAAFTQRLQKFSLAVRNVLNLPDIITLEEVENQSVANAMAAQVNTDAGVPNLYTAYSTDNSAYFTQDGTGISVGFLVKNTVNALKVTQFGQNESFTPSTSTNPITLNDRPWLVLNAGLKRAGAKDYPVTVIANHMKALSGINSTTSTSTRQKKELQAEDIAKYIQTLQAAGQHVISGGDFNAFEFSDGYTDTLGTYTNVNVLPASQVVQPGVAGLVTPSLVDLALLLPANQRYSYQEDGSAQILDHMVVTSDLASAGAHLVYSHMNADFPATAYNDATTPARNSDHDVAVGYFVLPTPVLSATLTPATAAAFTSLVNVPSTGQVFTFTNTGDGPITISSVATTGDYAVTTTCVGTLAISSSCNANIVFTPTTTGSRPGTLTFTTNVSGSTFARILAGTGNAAVLPTLSASTQDFGSVAIGATSSAKVITVLNTSTLATTVGSVAVTGDFSQTNTCGTSIPAAGSCAVTILFKPTVAGARTGTLTVATTGTNATTLRASLTGTGLTPDFSVADSTGSTTTSTTVVAGNAATVNLVYTPLNTFTGTVALSCTSVSAPTGVTCSVPASFALGAAASTQTATFTTTSRTSAASIAVWPVGRFTLLTLSLALLSFGGLLLMPSKRLRAVVRMRRGLAILIAGVAMLSVLGGCADSPKPNLGGTPAGTYVYTVTATSGTLTHTQTITLTVQ